MEFGVVEALGVIVVEVPGMDVDVAYIPDRHIGLVRKGLSMDERQDAADFFLMSLVRASVASPIPTQPSSDRRP